MLNCLIRTGNHICMGLRALNEQQEVSMNWREELRKEAEQLHKENEFYSFSATQIQQDKEYFGRFGGQELAT